MIGKKVFGEDSPLRTDFDKAVIDFEDSWMKIKQGMKMKLSTYHQ